MRLQADGSVVVHQVCDPATLLPKTANVRAETRFEPLIGYSMRIHANRDITLDEELLLNYDGDD